jgi:hypothetical protein
MLTRSDVQYQWIPDENLVRVVEGEEADAMRVMAASHLPEAGVYAPSFSLWDGTPVLDLLFRALDAPKQKGRLAPVLVVNLILPQDDGLTYLL